MGKRMHYIDALRVLAVLLLIPFHSMRVFNFGEMFYAKNADVSLIVAAIVAGISVWHMPLLFLLAGASSYFALAHRRNLTYVGERAKRLLIPLLFGTLVIVPAQMWYGAMTNDHYSGSLLAYWPRFFTVRADGNDYYGMFSPAHLWFILFLFWVSLAALPFMHWWRHGGGGRFASGVARRIAEPAWWPAVALVLLLSEALPEVGGKEFIRYLVFFLLGFIAMTDEGFVEAAERRRVLTAVVALVALVPTVIFWRVAEATPDPSWPRFWHALLLNGTAWVAILACLGWAKRLLDKPSPLLSYSAEASYPFYILHQTVIVAVAFYVVQLTWGILPKLTVVMLLSFGLCMAMYEGVRRVGPLRFLFGMKPLPRRRSVDPAEEPAA